MMVSVTVSGVFAPGAGSCLQIFQLVGMIIPTTFALWLRYTYRVEFGRLKWAWLTVLPTSAGIFTPSSSNAGAHGGPRHRCVRVGDEEAILLCSNQVSYRVNSPDR